MKRKVGKAFQHFLRYKILLYYLVFKLLNMRFLKLKETKTSNSYTENKCLILSGDFASLILFVVALASFVSCAKQDDNKPMNIVLIIADDLRAELSCYGEKHIHSPNIDRIAQEGVVFRNAFVQQAVCSASRASFLTGCYVPTVGVDYPYSEYFLEEFLPNHPTLTDLFYDHGYDTRTYGKVHHS